jgi:hypothetical protein
MGLQYLGGSDLLNAFYQANHAGLLPGQLGAAYFIPTFLVPLLLVTHRLGFRILLQRVNESEAVSGSLSTQALARERKGGIEERQF